MWPPSECNMLEKCCNEALATKCGFEKVVSRDCLHVQRDLQVFLSVYVGDFKLAGKTENSPKAWKLMVAAGLKPDTRNLSRSIAVAARSRSRSTETSLTDVWSTCPAYPPNGYNSKDSNPSGNEGEESALGASQGGPADQTSPSNTAVRATRYGMEDLFRKRRTEVPRSHWQSNGRRHTF